MAYFSQEQKKAMMPQMKALLKQYGLKGSVSVRNRSSVVLTLRSGDIDFGVDHCDVNVYWIDQHWSGVAQEFLKKAAAILRGPDYFDHSDSQTDYFHTSHYYDIQVGKWDKPYVFTGVKQQVAA
jgi:hypothetical protein